MCKESWNLGPASPAPCVPTTLHGAPGAQMLERQVLCRDPSCTPEPQPPGRGRHGGDSVGLHGRLHLSSLGHLRFPGNCPLLECCARLHALIFPPVSVSRELPARTREQGGAWNSFSSESSCHGFPGRVTLRGTGTVSGFHRIHGKAAAAAETRTKGSPAI